MLRGTAEMRRLSIELLKIQLIRDRDDVELPIL